MTSRASCRRYSTSQAFDKGEKREGIIIFFLPGKTPGRSKITKGNYKICLTVNLLWLVVISKTIVQKN